MNIKHAIINVVYLTPQHIIISLVLQISTTCIMSSFWFIMNPYPTIFLCPYESWYAEKCYYPILCHYQCHVNFKSRHCCSCNWAEVKRHYNMNIVQHAKNSGQLLIEQLLHLLSRCNENVPHYQVFENNAFKKIFGSGTDEKRRQEIRHSMKKFVI